MNALPEIGARAAVGPAILHPTDFSAGGAPALAHAVALALELHARLSLLHIRVADDAGPTRNGLAPIADLLVRWRLIAGGERFVDLQKKLGFSASCFDLPAPSVTAGVLDHFANHPAELAVLTTRAHSGLAYWFAGSTSRRALRQADTMILFLREGAPGFVDPQTGAVLLKRALIAVDGRIAAAGPIAPPSPV